MTPHRQLIIIEHRTYDITQHIGQALRNTRTAMTDGYPTTSPGSGSPGGGSITALSRPPRGTLLEHTDPARIAWDDLHDYTQRIATHASWALITSTQQTTPDPAPNPLARTVHAYRIARILTHTDPTTLNQADQWLTDTDHLHHTVTRWAYTTHTPARTNDLLATDLTEQWCRRHLTLGYREPRHRGDLCRWCYTHQAEQGQLPTDPMIEAHQAGNWRRLANLIHTATTTRPRPKRRRK